MPVPLLVDLELRRAQGIRIICLGMRYLRHYSLSAFRPQAEHEKSQFASNPQVGRLAKLTWRKMAIS